MLRDKHNEDIDHLLPQKTLGLANIILGVQLDRLPAKPPAEPSDPHPSPLQTPISISDSPYWELSIIPNQIIGRESDERVHSLFGKAMLK